MSNDCLACRELGVADGQCSPMCRDLVAMTVERDALQAKVNRYGAAPGLSRGERRLRRLTKRRQVSSSANRANGSVKMSSDECASCRELTAEREAVGKVAEGEGHAIAQKMVRLAEDVIVTSFREGYDAAHKQYSQYSYLKAYILAKLVLKLEKETVEINAMTAERDALSAKVSHLERGIEAYRANWTASLCAAGVCDDPEEEHDEEDWAAASDAVIAWEREDARLPGGSRNMPQTLINGTITHVHDATPYEGLVTWDEDAGIFAGRVTNIRDVITFAGCNIAELQVSMSSALSDYFDLCEELGKEPDSMGAGSQT